MTRIRTYAEMRMHETFEERFDYLVLGGTVGDPTFGFNRHINQTFYKSFEWHNVRAYVIDRDNGCDLGVPGYDIHADLLVHHINPMSPDDIIHGEDWIIDPNFLITTTIDTHNAIHYGNKSKIKLPFVDRQPGDTRLW